MTDIVYKFILSILGIIIITLFISIIFKKLTTVIEPDLLGDIVGTIEGGIQQGIDVATKYINAIGNLLDDIRKDIVLIPEDIGNEIKNAGEDTVEDVTALGKAFGNDMETIGKYLGDCATNFGESLICAVTKIENFSTCFKYYFIYILAKTLYLPISILVSIFRLKTYETLFFEYVDKFDCFIYDIFGFYLFHFSDEIQRKCFICEMNYPSPPDTSDFQLSDFHFPNDYSNMSDPFYNVINPFDELSGL